MPYRALERKQIYIGDISARHKQIRAGDIVEVLGKDRSRQYVGVVKRVSLARGTAVVHMTHKRFSSQYGSLGPARFGLFGIMHPLNALRAIRIGRRKKPQRDKITTSASWRQFEAFRETLQKQWKHKKKRKKR